MKYFGKKSVSHFLKLVLGMFWYLGLFTYLITIIFSVFSIVNNNQPLNIISTVGVLIIFSSIIYIVFQLRMILNTLIDEKPFSLTNVSRFRYTGYNILFIGIMLFASDLYFKGLATFTILNIGPGVYTNIDVFIPFVFGVFTLILAEIFKLGYEIHEENKLTI